MDTIHLFGHENSPWSRTGKSVAGAEDFRTAIQKAGLDWQVKQQFIQRVDGTLLDGKVAVYRDDTDENLGIVGMNTRVLQNHELFDFYQPWLDSKEVALDTAGCFDSGKRLWILGRINRPNMEIVPGDEVSKYLFMVNSHDGSLAVRVQFTNIRVVCRNTFARAINKEEERKLRTRHSRNMRENMAMMREVINLVDAAFEGTAEQYRQMARKQINAKDLQKFFKVVMGYDTTEQLGTRQLNTIENLVELFEAGRGQDIPGVKGTVWAAFNAVTEYANWQRGHGSEDVRLNSLWFGQNQQLIETARETALEMAV